MLTQILEQAPVDGPTISELFEGRGPVFIEVSVTEIHFTFMIMVNKKCCLVIFKPNNSWTLKIKF